MSGARSEVLSLRNLCVSYTSAARSIVALDGIDLDLARGETLAIVGESGCGKSTLALSLLGLLPPNARITEGSLHFDARALDLAKPASWSHLRGTKIGFVPQDTQAAFDPLLSIAEQIAELFMLRGATREAARTRTLEVLGEVGLENAGELSREFPERLSGGQRQRAAIAAALVANPIVLIADEPTSALDPVHARALIDLLDKLRRARGLALLWISHDLSAVAARANRTAIFYAGRVIEIGNSREVAENPLHPYTRLLLRSLPVGARAERKLAALAATNSELGPDRKACRFHSRCPLADDRCRSVEPALVSHSAAHAVACHYVEKAVKL